MDETKKHYFMTFAALFFLGLIVARPGSTFYPAAEKRECNFVKGKLHCEKKATEYQLNFPTVHYEFQQE